MSLYPRRITQVLMPRCIRQDRFESVFGFGHRLGRGAASLAANVVAMSHEFAGLRLPAYARLPRQRKARITVGPPGGWCRPIDRTI